ncbi:MAG TPA: FeoA family protein [Vicinamibacterales bacterium]|nr:FeoA family protein [Vicinamibacterales bacterium]
MRLVSGSRKPQALSSLPPGARGTVHHVRRRGGDRAERLMALGVTTGAPITVLQTFPGVVFLCDQTELAVERVVADTIFVKPAEG